MFAIDEIRAGIDQIIHLVAATACKSQLHRLSFEHTEITAVISRRF